MLLPLLLLSGAGWFGFKKYKEHKAFSPARKAAFERAMNDTAATSASLRSLAEAFEKEGLGDHARALRKRAALKEAPEPIKAARRAVFQKGLNSTDPATVEKIAAAHEAAGATGAAEALRLHAETLKAVKDA